MKLDSWGALQPEQVSKWINFDRDNADWTYSGDRGLSMASKQAEGVAYLWNTLALQDVAILADEVGMGKTFQALGVMSLLWKTKPNAKVLVMAPNRDICAHWEREYRSFLNSHFRETDHLVKNAADGGPVHEPHTFKRLSDLVDSLKSGSGNFYLTTIHSLSYLLSGDEKPASQQAKKTAARRAARKVHKAIKSALGEQGFDLIIVDEAHYLRNVGGGSQRVHAARTFFGHPDHGPVARLGQKNLLLTATPCHSKVADVSNILGYFKEVDDAVKDDVAGLLDQYGLRRLRLMKGQSAYHSKHAYRHEHAVPADFRENPESELFFALYQKKLVRDLGHSKSGRKFLYGYLEGFESVGAEVEDVGGSGVEDEELESAKDAFHKAPDTEILEALTRQYRDAFGCFPEHPKYGALVKEFVPEDVLDPRRPLHAAKHLAFVRRIPSVRELTQRVNEAYDSKLAAMIIHAWGLSLDDPGVEKWRKSAWSRRGYVRLLASLKPASGGEEELVEDESGPANEEAQDARLGSRIADLFTVKQGRLARTDCSNVSLRFRKPESLFALFLEPARDYRKAGYLKYYSDAGQTRKRAEYSSAAKQKRLEGLDQLTQRTEVERTNTTTAQYREEMPTAWGLVYDFLSEYERSVLNEWLREDKGIAENFANYLKAGFVFASPVMVEIYCWFTRFNLRDDSADVQQKYLAFVTWVQPQLEGSLLLAYFKSALSTFKPLCEKIIDHQLADWRKDWRVLTGLQSPAWYASGESKNRQRLILGFNSPFYPNVLIATSVFQEGVNLHMQCTKVHHYGIAWTPGDNEQRVGRVDRLFGKVNERLEAEASSTLDIKYPFLKNSFDEDQLASFIKSKVGVEKKLDECRYSQVDTEIDLEAGGADWQCFLRKPNGEMGFADPYPAKFDEKYLPLSNYSSEAVDGDGEIFEHVQSHLMSIIDGKHEKLFRIAENGSNPAAMFLVDPVVDGKSERRQPVLVERHFSSEFSSLVDGTVYYVTLKTPIASKQTLARDDKCSLGSAHAIFQKHSARFPLIRLGLDEDASLSHFYLNMRVDLPLFVKKGQAGMLSRREVEESFNELKRFADLLENRLFGDRQDLRKEDLKIFAHLDEELSDISAKNQNQTNHEWQGGGQWQLIAGASTTVAQLEARIGAKRCMELFPLAKSSASHAIACLELNNAYPFLKFSNEGEFFVVSVNYPTGDFQPEEQSLLESWFYHMTRAKKVK